MAEIHEDHAYIHTPKVATMIDTLEDIGQDVSEVIQGQHNDRIGLFNSGLNLYLESRNIQNPEFRMLVAAQALKSLSDGNEQILQALRADANYLLEGKYKQKKGRSAEEIQERMLNINKCFDVIHRSYLLKAGIYYERGEIQATKTDESIQKNSWGVDMHLIGKMVRHRVYGIQSR